MRLQGINRVPTTLPKLARATAMSVAVAVVGTATAALVLLRPFSLVDVALFAAAALASAGGAALVHRRLTAPHADTIEAVREALQQTERGNPSSRTEPDARVDKALNDVANLLNRLLAGALADRRRMRDVAARAFRAQEAERLRIARELQEEIAQMLATVLFRLRAARQTTEGAEREAALDAARDELTQVTDALRQFARALAPPALRELGVGPALEGYARALSATNGLRIQIIADELRTVLSAEGELALFRIVQEALGNAARHASATSVLVRIRNEGHLVRTFVEDDGRGFNLAEAEFRLPCLGLHGMRERALSVGGTVEIDTAPGNGTRLRVHLPLANAANSWPVILGRDENGSQQRGGLAAEGTLDGVAAD